jgi:hypothetical protein
MNRLKSDIPKSFLVIVLLIISGLAGTFSQNGGELRWLRVGSLHSFYSEQGAEAEMGRRPTGPLNDGLFWPAEYGYFQISMVSRAMWLGTTEFFDTKMQTTYPYKVVGTGPRNAPVDRPDQVMESELKLIGKFNHPAVIVDGVPATDNELYDVLDEVDPDLACDRMIMNIVNTSLGITVTRKLMAFSQQNHKNYFIYDYVFKNTGIIDTAGTVIERTLTDCVFYFLSRYSFAGESVIDYNNGWGTWNSSWGRNCVNHVIYEDPDNPGTTMRAHYAWYGPHSERPVLPEDDWGCPNEQQDGVMAAARYAGCVTLHADLSANNNSDDTSQPVNTWYLGSDDPTTQQYSQYDAMLMASKYGNMYPPSDVPARPGHPELTHAQEIELSGDLADRWGSDVGGYSQGQGFGPYDLAYGDSIHIVLAEGAAGISRAKNREVGGNWFQHYAGTGTPSLVMPNGSVAPNATEYKKAWVKTCEDSLIKTFRNAIRNYKNIYNIPQPPPPPDQFVVTSGTVFIRLDWSDNATSWPYFDGYVIYRSKDHIMSPESVYEKIFECDAANVVHQYNDFTAVAGFDYYYYIQTKDDGSTNDIEPGTPLYSSKFWTMTSVPAYSERISGMEESSGNSPLSFQLAQNYPNPFNPSTTICFTLPRACEVTLKLFDLLGREVETIYSGHCPAGDNRVTWQAKELANGIYLYRLQTGDQVKTRKMILVK